MAYHRPRNLTPRPVIFGQLLLATGLHVGSLPAVIGTRTASSSTFAWRVILPVLALIATLLLPVARPMHEAIEAATPISVDHSHDSDQEGSDPAPAHHGHDSEHCSVCATIGSLKQLTAASAFLFSLAHERAPAFIVPPYLAPATFEPALALVIPRGPPASV
jgi:hypothetical protein